MEQYSRLATVGQLSRSISLSRTAKKLKSIGEIRDIDFKSWGNASYLKSKQSSLPIISGMNQNVIQHAHKKILAFKSTKTIEELYESKVRFRIKESRRILEKGREHNSTQGISLIHAVLQRSIRYLEALADSCKTDIERIIEVNCLDQFGRSALHYACAFGDEGPVRMLLEVGADPRIRDFSGRTAFHYTAWNGNTSLFDSISRGRDISSMLNFKNYHTIARLIIYRKPHVTHPATDSELTQLNSKSINLDLSIFTEEIQSFIMKMNLPYDSGHSTVSSNLYDAPDIEGRTPLFHAVLHGNLAVIKYLLQSGANPKHEDIHGERPGEITTDSAIQGLLLSWIRSSQGIPPSKKNRNLES